MIRLTLTLCLVFGGCGGTSKENPAVRLAVTDVEGMEQLQIEFGAFRELLAERTKLRFEFFPVASRTAAVEALAHEKVDLVLTGPAEYVIFQTRTGIQPVIGLVREEYYSVFAVLEDSTVSELSDLRGKRVALGSIGSTSKHLAPAAMLAAVGLDPTKDLEVMHGPIRTGWEMLQRRQVEALATTSDKFALLLELADAKPVRVVAKSDQLPNDVLLARDSLDPEIARKVRNAIADASQEFITAILQGTDNQKYSQMAFDTSVDDKNYDVVRDMFKSAGLNQFAEGQSL